MHITIKTAKKMMRSHRDVSAKKFEYWSMSRFMLIIFFRKQKYAFYYKEGVTILQMVLQKCKFRAIRCDHFENSHTFRMVFRFFFRTFAADMITLGMMQFTAVVLMLLLTAKLLLLRGRRVQSKTARQARWLMASATAFLTLHFALQLHYGLRLMGITQSVMLNLAMLIPASFIFARAILLLQRRGQLSLADRWVGPLTWVAVMLMMGVATAIDGQPIICDSPELRKDQQSLKYTDWIATLRVEEAKRIMKEHPEWSNDAVAQHCGFTDRTVLQRTFKKIAGMTPTKFLEQQNSKLKEERS